MYHPAIGVDQGDIYGAAPAIPDIDMIEFGKRIAEMSLPEADLVEMGLIGPPSIGHMMGVGDVYCDIPEEKDDCEVDDKNEGSTVRDESAFQKESLPTTDQERWLSSLLARQDDDARVRPLLTPPRPVDPRLQRDPICIKEDIRWRLWDDINLNRDVPIVAITYPTRVMGDRLYSLINKLDKPSSHKKITGRLTKRDKLTKQQVDALYKHSLRVLHDKDRAHSILSNVAPTYVPSSTEQSHKADLLNFNVYYRRILRARLEYDLITEPLVEQYFIIASLNRMDRREKMDEDKDFFRALRLIRRICLALGIATTVDTTLISVDIFTQLDKFRELMEDAHAIFGETTLVMPIYPEEVDPSMRPSIVLYNRGCIVKFLSEILTLWSGGTLVSAGSHVQVEPPVYMGHILPYTRSVLLV